MLPKLIRPVTPVGSTTARPSSLSEWSKLVSVGRTTRASTLTGPVRVFFCVCTFLRPGRLAGVTAAGLRAAAGAGGVSPGIPAGNVAVSGGGGAALIAAVGMRPPDAAVARTPQLKFDPLGMRTWDFRGGC